MYFDCVLKSAHISWWGIILECSFQSLLGRLFSLQIQVQEIGVGTVSVF